MPACRASYFVMTGTFNYRSWRNRCFLLGVREGRVQAIGANVETVAQFNDNPKDDSLIVSSSRWK
jgi:hypothetical protein